MASKSTPDIPTGPLRDLMAWWRRKKIRGMLIGGFAVAILGRPRTTYDIDALITLENDDLPDFVDSGATFGFALRMADALQFAETNRVLLLQHVKSGVDVDISLAGLPFELDAIKRRQIVKQGRLSLPVPTVEDLIVLKAAANRPKDKIDIEGLLDRTLELDCAHIRKHVEELADLLEAPEIFKDLDDRLRMHSKKKSKK